MRPTLGGDDFVSVVDVGEPEFEFGPELELEPDDRGEDVMLYTRLTMLIPTAFKPGIISGFERVTLTALAILSADVPVKNAATM